MLKLLERIPDWSTVGCDGADVVHPRCNRQRAHSHTRQAQAVNLNVLITQTVQPFLVNPQVQATFEAFNVDGVDAGLWYNGTAYLLIVTNFNASSVPVYVPWSAVGLGAVTNGTTQVQRIFTGQAQYGNASGLGLGNGGIGIYTATPPQ
ncbi:hypothetical protein JVU11DRAFT_2018 [Chiua virens]|nr:hypothetical protein JVU11DRAFT_2018 [Chiua virens]